MGHIRCDRLALTVLMALGSALASGVASAAVVISSDATQNMSCANGICTPTAKDAVLNTGDLESLLASGNVTVTTTGSGVQAKDILVRAAVSWSTGSALTLDAYRSLTIDRSVGVQGLAALTLTTNDGGTNGMLSFGNHGNVTFANVSSSLTINGTSYMLENSIKSLAAAIAANPSGAFALANSYDASQDGTYSSSPIPTPLTGSFDGVGNSISNLSISDATDQEVGLFAELDWTGTLRDVLVYKANISVTTSDSCAAPLVGFSFGMILSAFASGSVNSENSCAGGLVGFQEEGTIELSHAATKVSGVEAGGLVGQGRGYIDQSFATGAIVASEYAGGLMGDGAAATVGNSYATGEVKVPRSGTTYVGGFASQISEGSQVSNCYSVGRVKGGTWGLNGTRGGFAGSISFDNSFVDNYWDTTTSGQRRGVGNEKKPLGITGLTTEQFQSGLPPGFDPAIWTEDPDINDGLPYLIANPPPR